MAVVNLGGTWRPTTSRLPLYEPDPYTPPDQRQVGHDALLAIAAGLIFGGGRGAAAAGAGSLQGSAAADQFGQQRADAKFNQYFRQRQLERQDSEAAATEAHRAAQLEIERQREARAARESELRPQLSSLDTNEALWNHIASAPPGAYPDEYRQKAPAAIAAIRAERARLTGQQPGAFQSPGEAIQGIQMPSMTPAEIAAGQRDQRNFDYKAGRDKIADQQLADKTAYDKQRDAVADEFKRQGIQFDERKFAADEKYRAQTIAIMRGDKALAAEFRRRELGMAGERLQLEKGREARAVAKDAREASKVGQKDRQRAQIGGEVEGHQRRLGQLDADLAKANDDFVSAATAMKADEARVAAARKAGDTKAAPDPKLVKARGDAMKRVGRIEAEKTKVKRRYEYLLKIGGGR